MDAPGRKHAFVLQPHSPLLRLASETRNDIYNYALICTAPDGTASLAYWETDGDCPVHGWTLLAPDDGPSPLRLRRPWNQLQFVCRQLAWETKGLERRSNRLVFRPSRRLGLPSLALGQFFRWSAVLPAQAWQHLQRIVLVSHDRAQVTSSLLHEHEPEARFALPVPFGALVQLNATAQLHPHVQFEFAWQGALSDPDLATHTAYCALVAHALRGGNQLAALNPAILHGPGGSSSYIRRLARLLGTVHAWRHVSVAHPKHLAAPNLRITVPYQGPDKGPMVVQAAIRMWMKRIRKHLTPNPNTSLATVRRELTESVEQWHTHGI